MSSADDAKKKAAETWVKEENLRFIRIEGIRSVDANVL